ncbi:hypothetical protein AHAS_Ahas03G0186600 [Arachis hypogaea]
MVKKATRKDAVMEMLGQVLDITGKEIKDYNYLKVELLRDSNNVLQAKVSQLEDNYKKLKANYDAAVNTRIKVLSTLRFVLFSSQNVGVKDLVAEEYEDKLQASSRYGPYWAGTVLFKFLFFNGHHLEETLVKMHKCRLTRHQIQSLVPDHEIDSRVVEMVAMQNACSIQYLRHAHYWSLPSKFTIGRLHRVMTSLGYKPAAVYTPSKLPDWPIRRGQGISN